MAANNQEPTLEDILSLANSPAKQQALLERIRQARALRNQPRQQYSTWAGALAGGLGDALNAWHSKSEEDRLQGEAAKQASDTDALRSRVLKMALGANEPQSAPAEARVTPRLDAGTPEGTLALQNQQRQQQERGNSVPYKGSPPSNYPPGAPTGSSPGSNTGGLVGQLMESYEPSPRDRASAVVSALRRNPGALATAMAASGDPVLGPLGLMQREDMQHAASATARQREQEAARERLQAEYLRNRRDKFSDTESDRAFQAEEHRLNRTSQERAARLSAGQRLETERRGAQVPGMEVAPDASPTPEDAKKVKASLAAAERMKKYVSELRELHAKHGTEYGGTAGNRMQQLSEAIKLEGKNIADLGALSGPDMAIMERLTQADPGGFTANVKGVFGADSTQSALKGVETWVDDTLSGNMAAYGYRKKGQGGASVDDVLKAFGR